MPKQKKKRNKIYTGQDAAVKRTTVTRVQAVNRSKLSQWWLDRKQLLKPILIAAVVAVVVAWLLYELIRAIW